MARTMRQRSKLWPFLLSFVSGAGVAQDDDAVVITATRAPQSTLEIPASVDRLYGDEIRLGRPQVNLSESLGRVPGIVVQNRQNYSQDLQISSRGFGARATFGVRGIRLIADGIPATMPDGQGQAATFSLGSADRIEVLRGPFSALYGNAAGGVIAIDTRDGPEHPAAEASFLFGSYGTWRAGLNFGGQWGALKPATAYASPLPRRAAPTSCLPV
jgi:iron complex outermembrane receptor protein